MNQEYVSKLLKSKHVRVGLPFLTTIVAGSFVVRELIQVKLDRRDDTANKLLKGAPPTKDKSPEREEERLKLQEAFDKARAKRQEEKAAQLRWKQENWKNLRGPREGEDEIGMQNEQRKKLGMPEVAEKEGILKYRNKSFITKEDL